MKKINKREFHQSCTYMQSYLFFIIMCTPTVTSLIIMNKLFNLHKLKRTMFVLVNVYHLFLCMKATFLLSAANWQTIGIEKIKGNIPCKYHD